MQKRITSAIARITRRRRTDWEPGMPSAILAELAAMGAVEADYPVNPQPTGIPPGELAKARLYARHGHLAYVNTFR